MGFRHDADPPLVSQWRRNLKRTQDRSKPFSSGQRWRKPRSETQKERVCFVIPCLGRLVKSHPGKARLWDANPQKPENPLTRGKDRW